LSIETEVKIRIDDPGKFCEQLSALNPGVVSDRHLEDNYLLDFHDALLKSRQCLLRVRFEGDAGRLTYKGPPKPDGIFKTREELEIKLDDGTTMVQILDRLGMVVCFRYQKYRREFLLDGIHVTVDETPIGNYIELEGAEEGIRKLALKMGIAESQFLRSSYYTLYLEHCRERGLTPKYMIFPKA
jgi:adenylate cyclase, class 2